MADFLKKAESWFFNSGIYVLDKDDPNYGAVYSYYDYKAKDHQLVYAEATGYAISLLKYLHLMKNDAKLIDLAMASGDWLVKLADRYDGIITMGIRGSSEIKLAYPFDNGIVCKGLLDLYELTKDNRYLEHAEKMAVWLVKKSVDKDGSVKPVFDTQSQSFMQDDSLWYKVSGSFHSKITMSLLQLHSINKNDVFYDAATQVCNWALSQQKPDGSFQINIRNKAVNLHTHCYTVETLLYAYALHNNSKFLEAAERATDWMLKTQNPDGSLWLWHGGNYGKAKPAYAISQFVRICLLLNLLNGKENLLSSAKRASQFLLTMQSTDSDIKMNGGLYEDISKIGPITRKSSHITSWATMFAMHAAGMLEKTGGFKEEISKLF
jgi:uncharacterized protein YyaL (SSP411 family)